MGTVGDVEKSREQPYFNKIKVILWKEVNTPNKPLAGNSELSYHLWRKDDALQLQSVFFMFPYLLFLIVFDTV